MIRLIVIVGYEELKVRERLRQDAVDALAQIARGIKHWHANRDFGRCHDWLFLMYDSAAKLRIKFGIIRFYASKKSTILDH